MFDFRKVPWPRLLAAHGTRNTERKLCSLADGGGARTRNLQHYALLRTQFAPPMCKTLHRLTAGRVKELKCQFIP